MNGKRVVGLAVTFGVLVSVFVLAVCVLKTPAEPSPGQGAHQHGVAHLNVAVDGADLYLEFISPSANIVGFEHPPRTEAQNTTVDDAVELLKDGESLFVPPAGAQCRLGNPTVDSDIDSDPGSESEGAHPHEHDEGDEPQRHSEFTADYHFVCDNPEELTGVDVMLSRAFPGIEHIGVLLLTGTEQAALELAGEDRWIAF